MKTFVTQLQAVDLSDGKLKYYVGQKIFANDEDEAKEMCRKFYPYLFIIGEFISEIDFKSGQEVKPEEN